MSEDTSKASGQSQSDGVESDDQTQVQPNTDKVSYDTYRKVLSEAKKAKASRAELEAELQGYKQKELEQKGESNQLIESLRKQLAEREASEKKMRENFAFNSFKSTVEALGAKHGCLDNEILLKSIDISAVEMSDDFSFNAEDLEREIAQLASKKSYLFQKKVPKVNDAAPTMPKTEKKKLTIDELAKMAASMGKT